MTPLKTDCLVVGSGVAGLRAAIEASRYGQVLLLCKDSTEESTSQKAQGGIAAVLHADPEEMEAHYQDTLQAGGSLCRPEAVRILVEEGGKRISELIAWGAAFDRIGSTFARALEGAHKRPRVLRAKGDATGVEMIKTLLQKAVTIPTIQRLSSQLAIDLIVEEGRCWGAWVLDKSDQTVYPVFARGVILATGGAGQLFSRTTNPAGTTGDGMAMALRAGAQMEDMEFVQFHPTALCLPNAPPFLLSEAMRGEGARLLNSRGKRFMKGCHPDKELAPRDIVARAMLHEMQQKQSVFLDITHLKSGFVRKRFPTIYATCLTFGIDIARNRIPVAPAAHYIMGGVKTDLSGQTSVDRLWAAGEVATTGIHGANRLASNALLEGIVFGARAGKAMAQIPSEPFPAALLKKKAPPFFSAPPLQAYLAVQRELQETLWNNVGIVRSFASIRKAMRMWHRWKWVLRPARRIPFPTTRKGIETRNLVTVAAALIAAAARRPENIGTHFREDLPEKANLPRHFSFRWSSVQKKLSQMSVAR